MEMEVIIVVILAVLILLLLILVGSWLIRLTGRLIGLCLGGAVGSLIVLAFSLNVLTIAAVLVCCLIGFWVGKYISLSLHLMIFFLSGALLGVLFISDQALRLFFPNLDLLAPEKLFALRLITALICGLVTALVLQKLALRR